MSGSAVPSLRTSEVSVTTSPGAAVAVEALAPTMRTAGAAVTGEPTSWSQRTIVRSATNEPMNTTVEIRRWRRVGGRRRGSFGVEGSGSGATGGIGVASRSSRWRLTQGQCQQEKTVARSGGV